MSVSPDGKWVVFGRQVDGKDDLVRIRPDGTGEFTDHALRGIAGRRAVLHARRRNDHVQGLGPQRQKKGGPPRTIQVYTIKHDGTNLQDAYPRQRRQLASVPGARWPPLRVHQVPHGREGLGSLHRRPPGRPAAAADPSQGLRRPRLHVLRRQQGRCSAAACPACRERASTSWTFPRSDSARSTSGRSWPRNSNRGLRRSYRASPQPLQERRESRLLAIAACAAPTGQAHGLCRSDASRDS